MTVLSRSVPFPMTLAMLLQRRGYAARERIFDAQVCATMYVDATDEIGYSRLARHCAHSTPARSLSHSP